jgi:glutathione S-transferase
MTHQVPVQPAARSDLRAATGASAIPVLVADGEIVGGEQAILAHLDERFIDPPEAAEQRAKAAKAKRNELEDAWPKLSAVTP